MENTGQKMIKNSKKIPAESLKYERPHGLAYRLRFLLKTDKFTDCSFVFGTEAQAKVFNAHQLILSAASPVFEAMFFGGIVQESPIQILDIQPTIFEMLLDYIYTDEVELKNLDDAQDMWYAANKYMIPKLLEICETKVESALVPNNACQVYEFAKFSDRPFLLHRSLQLIIDATQQVLIQSSFKNVQLSTLLMILDCSKLVLSSEDELLRAVLAWGTEKCKECEAPKDSYKLRQVIDPALKKIRFLNYTPDGFAGSMKNFNILSEAEYAAIFKNIVNKGTKFSLMPEGFSQCTESRIRR